jgi:hypothetical protein
MMQCFNVHFRRSSVLILVAFSPTSSLIYSLKVFNHSKISRFYVSKHAMRIHTDSYHIEKNLAKADVEDGNFRKILFSPNKFPMEIFFVQCI